MSPKVQILRSLVKQRITAAAVEIFGLFERTIAEYEQELCRTKEENQRQRQMLDCVWNPRVLIHKTDIQRLSVVKEVVPPEQQDLNPIVDQEEPQLEPPHIKDEDEELWISQEVNITKLPSTPVKSEDDDEEKVKSSQLNQTQTEENKVEANQVDCGGSEPSSSFHPHRNVQRKTDDQNEDSEETEDSDEDQTLNHKQESKLPTNSSTEQMETETDGDDGGGSEPDIILVHMESLKRRTFDSKSLVEQHMDTHTGQKLVGSSECEESFSPKKNATSETNSPTNMIMNTDVTQSDVGWKEQPYHCSVCLETFPRQSELEIHMRIHTGEKPFSCPLCGSRFKHKSSLCSHMNNSHTGVRTFTCSLCHKCFTDSEFRRHMRTHACEKPFTCSECSKRFADRTSLKCHMRLHTGERPFTCVVCQKCFKQKHHLQLHMNIHTGEKPFSCVVCQKRYTRKTHLKYHMNIHTKEMTE